jgi:hypothetical protein
MFIVFVSHPGRYPIGGSEVISGRLLSRCRFKDELLSQHGKVRLGNPMERKAVSQRASRPFGVPQLSMK